MTVPIVGRLMVRLKAAVSAMAPVDWGFTTNGGRGWWPIIREPFTGAWQRNITATTTDVLSHATAWSCIRLIASDIGKLRPTLIQEDGNGISDEITNTAYSPVLTKPNHYQNRIKFLETWIISKLTYGNTYILKERNNRGGANQGNVSGLYILDPSRVRVLLAPDGSIFYALPQDNLSGVTDAVTIPASEIIHDAHMPMFYPPICGVSPIYAAGRAVLQSLTIQENSDRLFQNGSQPGGILTSPTPISAENALMMQRNWETQFGGQQNIGKVAVLGGGLEFKPMAITAVDAQLIDQLKWGDERVCSVFGVPAYMVGVGPAPLNNNVEALAQQYYSQALQELIECIELCLVEGLEMSGPLGVELDLDGLIRMDSATKMTTATNGVRGGIYTPNEARAMFNKKPLRGGDTVYLQEQDHALEALAARDAGPDPFGKGSAPSPAPIAEVPPKTFDEEYWTKQFDEQATAMGLPKAA